MKTVVPSRGKPDDPVGLLSPRYKRTLRWKIVVVK